MFVLSWIYSCFNINVRTIMYDTCIFKTVIKFIFKTLIKYVSSGNLFEKDHPLKI
jgi:hypothetical protein